MSVVKIEYIRQTRITTKDDKLQDVERAWDDALVFSKFETPEEAKWYIETTQRVFGEERVIKRTTSIQEEEVDLSNIEAKQSDRIKEFLEYFSSSELDELEKEFGGAY